MGYFYAYYELSRSTAAKGGEASENEEPKEGERGKHDREPVGEGDVFFASKDRMTALPRICRELGPHLPDGVQALVTMYALNDCSFHVSSLVGEKESGSRMMREIVEGFQAASVHTEALLVSKNSETGEYTIITNGEIE
jgi:hypothetical protein